MKRDDLPMYDDPNESAFVRELLHAGRREKVAYDVEQGLAKHLAAIASSSSAPIATGAVVASKAGLPAWLGFVAVPLAAAGVAGVLWVFSEPRAPEAPSPAAESVAKVAPVSAPSVPVAPSVPSHAAEEDTEARSRDAIHGQSERRTGRASARSSAAQHPSRATSRSARSHAESNTVAVADAPERENDATRDRDPSASDAADGLLAANPYLSQREVSSAERASSAIAPPRAEETDELEPAAEATSKVAPAVARKTDKAPAPIIDDARLEREMQMLAVTQRVLASDPERALKLSQQGEREFPGSMLSAERRQLGLLALVKLGRLDEARRAGRPFLARYPKAPWSERLRRALATGKVE